MSYLLRSVVLAVEIDVAEEGRQIVFYDSRLCLCLLCTTRHSRDRSMAKGGGSSTNILKSFFKRAKPVLHINSIEFRTPHVHPIVTPSESIPFVVTRAYSISLPSSSSSPPSSSPSAAALM